MKKTAIILGASGATGTELVKILLDDSRYSSIKLFSRRPNTIQHEKVIEYVGNLFELEKFTEEFTANEVYCCIGTTQKQTPNKETYQKIDFGIPVTAAKLAKKNNISTFLVMSSIGANINSNAFYTKTKGEMEQAIQEFQIQNTYIFRPSVLIRKSKEKRILETLFVKILTIVNYLLFGKFKKYRSIKSITVAKTMIAIANSNSNKQLFLSDEIESIANKI